MKIVVLAGGTSTERDVSLSSGAMIYRALRERGHEVILLDVYLGYEGKKEGIFESERDWSESIGGIREENPDVEQVKAMRAGNNEVFFGPNVIDICREADIVFIALHGENGEDGRIQAAFDLMGIRYTGNDYVGSALAMDKRITKELFSLNTIPTPKGVYLRSGETDRREIALPCVVKTPKGGSSVGVYIVHTESEYEEAKKEAFAYEEEILIEEYIKGREFAIGVIQGKALPIIEIAPVSGFYDYRNKYQTGGAVETCPAVLPEALAQAMQKTAEDVFRVLRLTSYARMDFLLDENGDYYCLEANTLPGMTPISLLPQEAAAAGISYGELCEKIIKIS